MVCVFGCVCAIFKLCCYKLLCRANANPIAPRFASPRAELAAVAVRVAVRAELPTGANPAGHEAAMQPEVTRMSSDAVTQPRVLLMGTRRGGKSSIQNVVFHRMSPHETLFLESTNRTIKHDIASSSFLRFEVWDFPGHLDTASAAINPELTYGSGCGALVWVIDAQSDYYEALSRLQATIAVAHRINPTIVFEVFLHKVDNPNPNPTLSPTPNPQPRPNAPPSAVQVDLFTEDQRVECQRDVQSHLADEMQTACLGQVKINFHLTSIYDHSVFEAFSKVTSTHP